MTSWSFFGKIRPWREAQPSQAMQQLGAFKSVTIMGVKGELKNGVTTWVVGGPVVFDKDTKTFQATLHQQGENYKVDEFKLE